MTDKPDTRCIFCGKRHGGMMSDVWRMSIRDTAKEFSITLKAPNAACASFDCARVFEKLVEHFKKKKGLEPCKNSSQAPSGSPVSLASS